MSWSLHFDDGRRIALRAALPIRRPDLRRTPKGPQALLQTREGGCQETHAKCACFPGPRHAPTSLWRVRANLSARLPSPERFPLLKRIGVSPIHYSGESSRRPPPASDGKNHFAWNDRILACSRALSDALSLEQIVLEFM